MFNSQKINKSPIDIEKSLLNKSIWLRLAQKIKLKNLQRYGKIILKLIHRKSKRKLRYWIKLFFILSPIQFYRLFHTSMGKELILQLKNLTQYVDQADEILEMQLPKQNKIKFFGKFSSYIQLNLYWITQTLERFKQLNDATEKVVAIVKELAQTEIKNNSYTNFDELPDLRKSGNYSFIKETFFLEDHKRDLSFAEARCDRKFQVVIYYPQSYPNFKTPLIVISHGLGASPADFKEYAQYLASHGYTVAIPQHPGSDASQIENMLAGAEKEIFQLQEFLNRPLDITYLLDELERGNPKQFKNKLNLEEVGVIGHSFGAYTTLALAGAEINFDKLEKACSSIFEPINLSLLLQCRALHLPRKIYNFRDKRIKAILPIDCVGSEIFGANGISQIKIPLLMIAGTEDRTAPAILEQIRIFPWLKTTNSYLALMKGKAHISTFSTIETRLKVILAQLVPNKYESDLTIFCNYAYAISLAFFEVYLRDNQNTLTYLQAGYAQYLTQKPFDFYLINSLSAKTLKFQVNI